MLRRLMLPLLLASALALAACAPPGGDCDTVLPSGCVLITDQETDHNPPPGGWVYFIEDDGDLFGYWTNEPDHAFDAPRLGWSWGPAGDIYASKPCGLTRGADT